MEVKAGDSRLYYRKYGTGSKVLLLFHGFGQSHFAYESLTRALERTHTCFAFDLFFHGESTWAHGETAVEKKEWKKFIDIFLLNEQVRQFSLCGFSMGAKFVLATLELYPRQVEQLFLIAPDGIKNNFWYKLATNSWPMRRAFKRMIVKEALFNKLAQWLERHNLVDKHLVHVANYQMGTEEKRRRVYYSWVVFRKLTFNMKKIGALIELYRIKTVIIVGKDDPLIAPQSMSLLTQHLTNYHLESLNRSHYRLIDAAVPLILKFC